MEPFHLEDLIAWKKGRELRREASRIAKSFPAEERYILKSQVVRSSRSVPANIAEGFGRFHYQENIQFCRQARGSLVELLEHYYCALDEEYITEETFRVEKNRIEECKRIINGYISYLKKAKSGQ